MGGQIRTPPLLHRPPFTGTRPRHSLAVEAHAQSFGTQWGFKNRVEPGCKIVVARSIVERDGWINYKRTKEVELYVDKMNIFIFLTDDHMLSNSVLQKLIIIFYTYAYTFQES
jgi:hypothetical protein